MDFLGYKLEPVYNNEGEYCYSQYLMNFKEIKNGNR